MSSAAIRRAPPANTVGAAVTTGQIFTLASNPLLPVTVGAPGKLALEAKRFTVRAEGSVKTAVDAYTVKASLLAGLVIPATPLTIGNWTLLGAGTARAVATAGSVPWWIEANLIFDSVGGAMQGTFQQLANNLFDGSAAIANQITGINGTNVPVTQGANTVQPADPVLYFAVALTFGTANAGNLGTLANFEIAF
jgi:hypothetical protein